MGVHQLALRIAVLTVSDACASGARNDVSGTAISDWTSARGHTLAARACVPDEPVDIVRQLVEWCDNDAADVVLTTGGTGVSPRDRTPEATRTVIELEAPGLIERIRVLEVQRFPRSALSRAVAGIRNRVLIVNLPGSPGGVSDSLNSLEPLLVHVVAIARGKPTDHSPGIM